MLWETVMYLTLQEAVCTSLSSTRQILYPSYISRREVFIVHYVLEGAHFLYQDVHYILPLERETTSFLEAFNSHLPSRSCLPPWSAVPGVLPSSRSLFPLRSCFPPQGVIIFKVPIPYSKTFCPWGYGFLLEVLQLLRSWLPPQGALTLKSSSLRGTSLPSRVDSFFEAPLSSWSW